MNLGYRSMLTLRVSFEVSFSVKSTSTGLQTLKATLFLSVGALYFAFLFFLFMFYLLFYLSLCLCVCFPEEK